MLFSFASLDARPRLGAAGAEELVAPPRFLGGCEGVRFGFGIDDIWHFLPCGYHWQDLELWKGVGMDKMRIWPGGDEGGEGRDWKTIYGCSTSASQLYYTQLCA